MASQVSLHVSRQLGIGLTDVGRLCSKDLGSTFGQGQDLVPDEITGLLSVCRSVNFRRRRFQLDSWLLSF